MAKKKDNKALKKLLLIIGLIISLSLLITFYLYKSTNYTNSITYQPKIDTSTWKSFSNEKYSFSFKYPANLTIVFPAPSFDSSNIPDFDSTQALYLEGNRKPALELTLNAMPTSGTSLDLQRKSFKYPGSKNIESEILINGVKAYKFTAPDSNNATILVENNGTIFSISKGQAMHPDEFNAIIDSLTFSN